MDISAIITGGYRLRLRPVILLTLLVLTTLSTQAAENDFRDPREYFVNISVDIRGDVEIKDLDDIFYRS